MPGKRGDDQARHGATHFPRQRHGHHVQPPSKTVENPRHRHHSGAVADRSGESSREFRDVFQACVTSRLGRIGPAAHRGRPLSYAPPQAGLLSSGECGEARSRTPYPLTLGSRHRAAIAYPVRAKRGHGEGMDARVEATQEQLPDAQVEATQERLPDARVEAT